jgi:hypothetical protein
MAEVTQHGPAPARDGQPTVPSGRERLRRSGPARPPGPARPAERGKAAASLDRLPAPQADRPGSSPARIRGNGAGRGSFGIVRGCPLGTAQDRYEWHARGTAGEDDDAHTRRRRLTCRRERESRRWRPTASMASREGGAAAMAAKPSQQPAGPPAKSGWPARCDRLDALYSAGQRDQDAAVVDLFQERSRPQRHPRTRGTPPAVADNGSDLHGAAHR